MPIWFFVSDLHGREERFRRLWEAVQQERPSAVFLGGDLTALAGGAGGPDDLRASLERLRERMRERFPRVYMILGNDDPRTLEAGYLDLEERGLLVYVHGKAAAFGRFTVIGYSFVPPTPFQLKDWERYDVSRYTDPGCVSPEEGTRSVPVDNREIRLGTIRQDLEELAEDGDMEGAILLCHAPPYRSNLDRAALDGQAVDHAPLDVHVGSIALKRFIRARQPWITLHGHVHESARITGAWRDRIGRTRLFSAAHDGPELALVRFDPDDPDSATRELL